VTALAAALPEPPLMRAGRALSFTALSLPPLLLALPGWLPAARRAAARSGTGRWLYAGALIGALWPERLARGSLADLAGPVVYAAAVLLITADRPRGDGPLRRDPMIILLLWLPLELGWMTGDFTLLRLFGLDLLLLLYVVERPTWELDRLLPFRGRQIGWGVGAYAAFLVPAIPLALATGFATPGISVRPAAEWALFLVVTYWVIALPEEALFRGTIQGLLERVLHRPWWALAPASILFGLSHLNNSNGQAPDWRYVLLATLAGIAYGLAYIKTRSVAAPTLTHFLVDVTWRGFFAGER
jgi:membrane protease YdiL (CAAX protease family)